MQSVEDWAEIRRLHFSEGLSIRAIASRLGVHRMTVRRAVRSTEPPAYRRPLVPSKLDPFKEAIAELLREVPDIPATVIAERVGYGGGLTILRDHLREVRPLFQPANPIQRTTYAPGELAQWDFWIPEPKIPVGYDRGLHLPVWLGVSGYSRFAVGLMVPSRRIHDLLAAHLRGVQDLGGVPRAGIYDNEKAIVASRRSGEVRFTSEFLAFAGALCFKPVPLRPRFPRGKGLVERLAGYLETSFLPGRRFEGVEDFNHQLGAFLERANHRQHRELRCRPVDRIAEDRAAMLPLPPVLPDVSWRFTTRVGRDHHVRVDTCDYSVHPRAIGRIVQVQVTLAEVVARIGSTGEEVGRHARSLCPHRTITHPSHARARREMTGSHRGQDDVEIRDLASYDRAFGLDGSSLDRRSENGSGGFLGAGSSEGAA